MRFVLDLDVSAGRRQHPNRDLESTSARLYDSDCPITGFRSADDPKSFAVQRVEGIENLNLGRLRAQGIVGAGVITRMFTASLRLAAYRRITRSGFVPGVTTSLSRKQFSVRSSVASSSRP